MEKLCDILGQWCSARNKKSYPAARLLNDFGKNELVSKIVFKFKKSCYRLIQELFPAHLSSGFHSPKENLFLQA